MRPSVSALASLTDGRLPGSFKSVYPKSAWIQIALELTYLVVVLCLASITLIKLSVTVVLEPSVPFFPSIFGTYPQNHAIVIWLSTALAGCCGGAAASLKWLYHSVAKQTWHRDRVIWRIVVPPLSSLLSVFTGLMIVSGIIPIFSKTPLSNPSAGAAFGFFAGFFSDNLLAALQKLAMKVFGTVDKSGD